MFLIFILIEFLFIFFNVDLKHFYRVLHLKQITEMKILEHFRRQNHNQKPHIERNVIFIVILEKQFTLLVFLLVNF